MVLATIAIPLSFVLFSIGFGGPNPATLCQGGNIVANGKISPGVGKGMTASAQQEFQKIVVAAASKYDVDPDYLATFYNTESGRSNDPTNNADASVPPAVTNGGDWREPAPPVGNGPPYITNKLGYSDPYGLSQSDMQTYGYDGQTVATNLTDAAYAAAHLLAHDGAKVGSSNAKLFAVALMYNHSSTYAQSVMNIYHYLKGKGSSSVSGTTGTCSSSASVNCNLSSGTNKKSQVTGDAAILCEAEKYKGIYYLYGGAHAGYDAFRQQCPLGAVANAASTSTAYDPGPCATDCSGLVYVAVDQAFHQQYSGIVADSSGIMTAATQYWKHIPFSQAQPGDIVTSDDGDGTPGVAPGTQGHVEIVVSINQQTGMVTSFGSHYTGTRTGFDTGPESGWNTGAWHWIGPGSQPASTNNTNTTNTTTSSSASHKKGHKK